MEHVDNVLDFAHGKPISLVPILKVFLTLRNEGDDGNFSLDPPKSPPSGINLASDGLTLSSS